MSSFLAGTIHRLRVLYKDLMLRNTLWSEETGQVMVIDFERAKVEQRTVLWVVSPNRKRKRGIGRSIKRGQIEPPPYTQETRRAAPESNGLVDSIVCR